MKQIVIIELFFAQLVLIVINSSPVLTANLTVADDKYIGVDKSSLTCVLSSFNATITVKPFNETFSSTTLSISPETAIAKSTKCSDLIAHYYRFNDTFDRTDKRQSLISVGFEIGVGHSVEMHIKYIQVFCNEPLGCLRYDRNYCSTKDMEQLKARNCLRMSASYSLVWLKEGQTYQCSHNSRQTLRDVGYVNEVPEFRGNFEINLHYVRIDANNSTQTFNPIQYCLLDWVLDTTVVIIMSSIVCLIVFSLIFKCLYDCRSGAKRRKYRTNESLKWNKSQTESDTEKLGPTVEL